MNTFKSTPKSKSLLSTLAHSTLEQTTLTESATRRQPPRSRDFGVGYGSSSGYATERRYTQEWSQTRFRMT